MALTDYQGIEFLKNTYWPTVHNVGVSSQLRPEFSEGPFNVIIQDYNVSAQVSDAKQQYRTILFNCYFNRFSTVRRIDGSPSVEVYNFIFQSAI